VSAKLSNIAVGNLPGHSSLYCCLWS